MPMLHAATASAHVATAPMTAADAAAMWPLLHVATAQLPGLPLGLLRLLDRKAVAQLHGM